MAISFPHHKLGKDGPEIPVLGFGMMGLSAAYGAPKPDPERMALLDHIYEKGERFWDSSISYGDSEELLGRWFATNPEKRKDIFLATKFGITIDPKTQARGVRNDVEHMRECIERSLKRLQTDYIDLYYVHRIQNDIPIEATMREMKKLKEEGKIKYIGLSEASAETLKRACKVAHVDAHQVEYSPFTMDIENPQTPVLKTSRELGIATVAYSPLGRGFLTGSIRTPNDFGDKDVRKFHPRFSGENFHKNLELVDLIQAIAKEKGCTGGQLVLAFLMAQGDDIFPIPGTTRIQNFDENVASLKVKLTDDEIKKIRQAMNDAEVVGDRYPPGMMLTLQDTVPEK